MRAFSRASRGHSVWPIPNASPVRDDALVRQVLFAVEGILCKLQQHASDLPWRDELSLAPILECLSIDSIILLFTAVLLEER